MISLLLKDHSSCWWRTDSYKAKAGEHLQVYYDNPGDTHGRLEMGRNGLILDVF